MIAPMLPTWLANDCASAFSVCVLVSAGELANSASICVGDLGGLRRIGDPQHVPADDAQVAAARRLVQVVVVEEKLEVSVPFSPPS